MYWAARQGHVDVIKFLKDQAVTIDMQNNVSSRFTYFHNLVQLLVSSQEILETKNLLRFTLR